jgi:hypothetical protein
MGQTNAERQRQYINRLKEKAAIGEGSDLVKNSPVASRVGP